MMCRCALRGRQPVLRTSSPGDRPQPFVVRRCRQMRHRPERVNGDRAPWRPGSREASLSLHDSAWGTNPGQSSSSRRSGAPREQRWHIWASNRSSRRLGERLDWARPGQRPAAAAHHGRRSRDPADPDRPETGSDDVEMVFSLLGRSPRPRQRQPGPTAEAPIASDAADIGLSGRSVYCSAAERATDDL